MKIKDRVITSDTDSVFFELKDLILHRNPQIDFKNRKEVIEICKDITTQYQEKTIPFLNTLSKNLFNCENKYFELKQEVILERGYFADKRRYAIFIVNKEGVDTEELDMKGLDIMKSNMAPIYKKFGEEILMDIMYGKNKDEIDEKIISFKKKINTLHYKDISRPTGVKNIKKYIAGKPGEGNIFSSLALKCPINTRAAIYYNDLIKFHKLNKQYQGFVVGDKMYYCNLKDNPYQINVLGFRGNDEDPQVIVDILEKYADRETTFKSVFLNKLTNIYSDLKWSFPALNTNVSKFFSFS